MDPNLREILRSRDPIKFQRAFWPGVEFYNKQHEIIYSVRDNRETYVPAGNKLGKDYVGGWLPIAFLLRPWMFFPEAYVQEVESHRRPGYNPHTVRILTTSVDGDQLGVIWAEIGRFLTSCRFPLLFEKGKGGCIIAIHQEFRFSDEAWTTRPVSYLRGRVGSPDNDYKGLSGHHAAYTMALIDESAAVPHLVKDRCDEWASKIVMFGNCNHCAKKHFFYVGCKGGDDPPHKKVIRIKAEDSPSVRRGLDMVKQGLTPDDKRVLPGLISYGEYVWKRKYLDAVVQCVSLDADWYEGAENLLYPPEWLNRAERIANGSWIDPPEWLNRHGTRKPIPKVRQARAMGIDPAQGGDSTVWTIVDQYGIIFMLSMKTPDTSMIPNKTIALVNEYKIPWDRVMFDTGGGGYEHTCELERRGHRGVRSISFQETPTLTPKRGLRQISEKVDLREERYAYVNRRAEMYGLLSILLNPANEGWAIPAQYSELRRQLAPIPRWEDGEGRLFLPSKNKKPGEPDDKVTMKTLIGNSPDEADSLVLAIFGMTQRSVRPIAGAVI